MSHLVNIGNMHTLIHHRAGTDHRKLDEVRHRTASVRPNMVSVAVGLEQLDDILWVSTKRWCAPQPEDRA